MKTNENTAIMDRLLKGRLDGEEGINLDGLNETELWDFWKACGASHPRCPRAIARQLFPSQPQGYDVACKQLANYAANAGTARLLRVTGKISAALKYEQICDTIYQALPEYARW